MVTENFNSYYPSQINDFGCINILSETHGYDGPVSVACSIYGRKVPT